MTVPPVARGPARVFRRHPTPVSRVARDVHDASLVADLHIDTFLLEQLFGYDIRRRHTGALPFAAIGRHVDLPRLREGGVSMAVFGVVIQYWGSGERRRRATREYIARFRRVLEEPASRVVLADDLESAAAARRDGKIAACLGIEGAHALGGDASFLAECRDLGVRSLGLSHFANNEAATCGVGRGADLTTGLTGHGRDLVDAANRLGVVLDLAHLNKAGFLEVCRRSQAPVLVSHAAVYARHASRRNVDDEMLKALAGVNGTIGIIFAPQWLNRGMFQTAEEIILHAEHVRDLVGPDHVSLGSDFDGFVSGLPVDLRGAEDYPVLTEWMLRRGWKEEHVRKALGLNALRVFGEVRRARKG